ncbi:MAG: hypothetical protein ACREMW_13825 [Gemmatimonadales bacterium]
MINQFVTLIVDESKWFTASMSVAFLAVAVLLYRYRHSSLPGRRRILAAMNLFCGVTIGTMAFGHILAVTTKLAVGSLEGPVPMFYAIGIALAAPSWWLIYHTRRVLAADADHGRRTLVLNTWLAITLLVLGIQNLLLAAPALLNIGYHLHAGRVMGWVIVSMAIVVNVSLFIGSVIFLASGQSFEQFRGMQ